MSWGVEVNRPHVLLWARWGVAWLLYVAVGLVVGWQLKPRPDEITFVLFLPLAVLVPYAAACLILGLLRTWLWAPVGWQRRLLGRVLAAQQRIGGRTRRPDNRLA